MSWNNPRDLVIEWMRMEYTARNVCVCVCCMERAYAIRWAASCENKWQHMQWQQMPLPKGREHNPMSDFDISILNTPSKSNASAVSAEP